MAYWQHTAVCRYPAQENPPEEPHEEEDGTSPAPWLVEQDKDENVDNSFSVLSPPHEGQGA